MNGLEDGGWGGEIMEKRDKEINRAITIWP